MKKIMAAQLSDMAFVHMRCKQPYQRLRETVWYYPGVTRLLYAGSPELPKECAHCRKQIARGKEEADEKA